MEQRVKLNLSCFYFHTSVSNILVIFRFIYRVQMRKLIRLQHLKKSILSVVTDFDTA